MSLDNTNGKLVRMANQIATFFKSQPEAERVPGIATHINKFWEPRMRKALRTDRTGRRRFRPAGDIGLGHHQAAGQPRETVRALRACRYRNAAGRLQRLIRPGTPHQH